MPRSLESTIPIIISCTRTASNEFQIIIPFPLTIIRRSNLLRLWILRVCQQTEKHLDKIINVDEFVKRIFWVTHSNNPMERALAIRTLGSVAVIIAEKQQVHHAIRSSLDSHDIVEIEAAIYASGRFASQSK